MVVGGWMVRVCVIIFERQGGREGGRTGGGEEGIRERTRE